MASLPQLRKQIDRLDDRLVALLNRRFELAEEIGVIKAGNGHKVHDPSRERELLARICRHNKGPLSSVELRSIYRALIAISRRHQKRIRKTVRT